MFIKSCISIYSFFGALLQFIFAGVCMMQRFGVIDVLRGNFFLILFKIMYFHCARRDGHINVGQVVDGVLNFTYVSLETDARTSIQTFYVNCVSLSIALIVMLISGLCLAFESTKVNKCCTITWISATLISLIFDVGVGILYLSDIQNTRDFQALLNYVGGDLIGSYYNVNTVYVAWTMAAIYNKFIIFPVINCVLIIINYKHLAVNSFDDNGSDNTINIFTRQIVMPTRKTREYDSGMTHRAIATSIPGTETRHVDDDLSSVIVTTTPTMFGHDNDRVETISAVVPTNRVRFPTMLMSLPQRVERIMAENAKLSRSYTPQSKHSIVDISRDSQDLAEISQTENRPAPILRRMTATDISKHFPWSYMPTTVNRAEALVDVPPPVPVPDYTLPKKYRRASVHRVANVREPTSSELRGPGFRKKSIRDMKKLQDMVTEYEAEQEKHVPSTSTSAQKMRTFQAEDPVVQNRDLDVVLETSEMSELNEMDRSGVKEYDSDKTSDMFETETSDKMKVKNKSEQFTSTLWKKISKRSSLSTSDILY